MLKHRARRGFTLLELLVVVVILGVLALVAIPVFRQFTSSANTTSALESAKNIASHANATSVDTGETYTTITDVKNSAIGAGLGTDTSAKSYYKLVESTPNQTDTDGCVAIHVNGAYARITIDMTVVNGKANGQATVTNNWDC